jgi:hypothetical protein
VQTSQPAATFQTSHLRGKPSFHHQIQNSHAEWWKNRVSDISKKPKPDFRCKQINLQQSHPFISPQKSSFSRLLISEGNPVFIKFKIVMLSDGKTGFLKKLGT